MPCSCGGMRRSGLAPSNISIRQKQPTQIYTPPPQIIQTPPPPPQQPKPETQSVPYQSNRPNFSGNLPSIRRR
jgi:hypothetical protein